MTLQIAARPKSAKMATRDRKADRTLSLTEQVYSRLRGEILSCQLAPGQEISESELAERFQVSKTPVREALATLRQEGLVKTFPRRGYQVTPITFGDMNELFDLRTILEAGAAELACEQITDEEIARLRGLGEIDYDKSSNDAITAFITANRAFHLAIAAASRNARLYGLLERQLYELDRFFYLGAQLRDVNGETNTEHSEIIAALERRDRMRARELMIRHNDLTRQGLFQALAMSRKFGSIAL